MKHKPIYKLVDGKGRVLIPKELRTASGMDYGDIVRLGLSNGTVSVQKINIIEVGDQSPVKEKLYCWRLPLRGPICRLPQVAVVAARSSEASFCSSFSWLKSLARVTARSSVNCSLLLTFTPQRSCFESCRALA